MKKTLFMIFFLMIAFVFVNGCDLSVDGTQSSSAARAPVWNITEWSTGKAGNWFYSFYTDTQGASMRIIPMYNSYLASCSAGNMVCGIGSEKGSEIRVVRYKADEFEVTGGNNTVAYLCLYGWAKHPRDTRFFMIEYYIVEAHGSGGAPDQTTQNADDTIDYGIHEIDGADYHVWASKRHDKPFAYDWDGDGQDDTGDFWQYWSVRVDQRTEGVIKFKKHVDKWRELGMLINRINSNYQIMATEGFGCTVNSDVNIINWTVQQKAGRATIRRFRRRR